MAKIQFKRGDGITVDLGWHDAPEIYRHAFDDERGLHALHQVSSATVALQAAFALRDMLCTPLMLASIARTSVDEVYAAADFLYRLAVECHHHGIAGFMEVCE